MAKDPRPDKNLILCEATVKRHRPGAILRYCSQRAIHTINGKNYCYYHNPKNPNKFGEGYSSQ